MHTEYHNIVKNFFGCIQAQHNTYYLLNVTLKVKDYKTNPKKTKVIGEPIWGDDLCLLLGKCIFEVGTMCCRRPFSRFLCLG